MSKILIIGAGGQIGSELLEKLREIRGKDNVIGSDIRPIDNNSGPNLVLDVLDKNALKTAVIDNDVSEIYLMAALLSATAEKNPDFAWKLNMDGLFNVLNLAKDKIISKVFWPSSIAVFGPTTPKENTPQNTIMHPSTVYGISKLAGERWCEYYHKNHGVDVRSIRYPGIISWKSLPGGGTTDYAVDIFYEALKSNEYTSFLSENTGLPMMFMDDAIKATMNIMSAPNEKVKIRSSYNLSAVSFTPKEIAQCIANRLNDFKMSYSPDFRQGIADSWPSSIDDSEARKDWSWSEDFNLEQIVDTMLLHLSKKLRLSNK